MVPVRKLKIQPDPFCSNTSNDRVLGKTNVAPISDCFDLHGHLDAINIRNRVMDSLLLLSPMTTVQLCEQPIQ